MAQDYNATLNLPRTDFPMRAGLPKREPDMLADWYEKDLYKEILKKNEGRPTFILHDGPPFSNGYIHMGTVLNKCIKDFIVRYKNMSGFSAPYVPGWDNHGMPIESAIIKQNKLDRKKMSIPEFRNACHEFAQKFVDIQREQFKRLGVLGDWDNPYLTMNPAFEAEEVKVFGEMFEKGYIYKGKKPVYWCTHDETALAEAEIEYSEDECESIFVKFALTDDKGRLGGYTDLAKTYFVIWTTTTWTIPGNLAICVNADLDYVIAKAPNGESYIVAKGRLEAVGKAAGIDNFEILHEMKGSELELMRAKHPLYNRESIVINGEHVTLDAGTGCVHTAPGHGQEDFEICRRYEAKGVEIGMLVPVDDRGIMTEAAGEFAGMHYSKANTAIFDALKNCGALLASEKIVHQYAHCWRCKEPILYRATDQWFCSVDAFKDAACAQCDNITWIPEWGHDRMMGMIRERADWCISRQRHWGLPIPVFYCEDCGKPVCTKETIEKISAVFAEKGSNVWFEREAAELLPEGYACPHCGGKKFTKETDTLDGWFDSGSSHRASLEKDHPEQWPADMYMEGGDQYRGWFQSSLLTAVATRGKAPYKSVLTHGWTVDGEGRAMHKSAGNYVMPDDLIPKYGADLLRLWAASSDYHMDMRCSDAIFKQLSDKYLKIRNTARYILGNLDGFDPNGLVPFSEMEELDKWAVVRLNELTQKCLAAYERYEFHVVTYAVHNFCVVDMSNFYLDIIKDRLYCDETNGKARRSAQSAIYMILDAMVRILAPVLAFTSNEIWLSMPHAKGDNPAHVMLNDMPKVNAKYSFTDEQEKAWERLIALRNDVNKALELARAEKTIGKPLDAEVTLYFNSDERAKEVMSYNLIDATTLFIVSAVNVKTGEGEGYKGETEGVTVAVTPAETPKCERCWTHNEHVNEAGLCPRCAKVVK